MSLSSVAAFLLVVSFPGFAASASAQDAGAPARRTVIAGRVLAPDGAPAAGAIVRTSAGGETLAGPRGRFALEIELPLDADDVEVTALGPGAANLVASARVVPSDGARTTWVGALALAPSDDCHERWLPTFGSQPG